MQERLIGSDHPDYGGSLSGLAGVMKRAGRLREADSLFAQAIAVRAARQSDRLTYGMLHERLLIQLELGDTALAREMLRTIRNAVRVQNLPDVPFARYVDSLAAVLEPERQEGT